MPDQTNVVALSTSLLNHDFEVAKAIASPPPRGSIGERKIKALASLIKRQTPSAKAPPIDPLDFLQRAIAIVLEGEGNRGVSMSRVIERTNRSNPLTRCFLGLRAIRHSIQDLAEMQAHTDVYSDWSPSQQTAIGDTPIGRTRGVVFLGYRVEVPALLGALGELRALEQSLSSADPFRPVVMGCLALITRSLHQLQPHLAQAGSEWLEVRFLPSKPGQYRIEIVAPEQIVADEPAPIARASHRPELTSIDMLLLWVEKMIERCLRDGEWTHVSQAAAMAVVHELAAPLYARAIKTAPVADVHLAIRWLVDRMQAELDSQTAGPENRSEKPAFLLLTDQSAPSCAEKAIISSADHTSGARPGQCQAHRFAVVCE